MKQLFLGALLIAACAGSAFGQGGHIGLYSDSPSYADPCLLEALFVTNVVYVVHSTAIEANTSEFKVENNWAGPIVGAVSYGSNLFLGDIYTGVTITYVGCKPLPHLLATLSFIPVSATPECTTALQVVADPVVPSGQIEVIDCSSNTHFATGGTLYVNATLACPFCAFSTEESTWGRVKALYQ